MTVPTLRYHSTRDWKSRSIGEKSVENGLKTALIIFQPVETGFDQLDRDF